MVEGLSILYALRIIQDALVRFGTTPPSCFASHLSRCGSVTERLWRYQRHSLPFRRFATLHRGGYFIHRSETGTKKLRARGAEFFSNQSVMLFQLIFVSLCFSVFRITELLLLQSLLRAYKPQLPLHTRKVRLQHS